MKHIAIVSLLMVLGACSEFGALTPEQAVVPVSAVAPETLDPTPPPPPPPEARTVEDFDTTTAEDREAAVAAPDTASEVELGTTIASLGAPTIPGIWMQTPLVSEIVMGRVAYAPLGTSVALELRPSGGEAGSGSQISLAAMRLLEVPLTELPELVVYR
jgi:hypothetical protein